VNDNVACVTQLVCLEDGKRARKVALEMGSGYHTSLVFRYLDTFPRPAGVPQWPQLIPEPTPEQLEERIRSGNRIVGNPDECAEVLQKYVDIGCDQIIFGVLASTQTQETARESVATFGKHVIPRFDKDPVHSTTRMRERGLKRP
jgi:alkanesulfonate monooxygenase SsuD/methylene tetrahydromethanopterin reductase-like flavin-dependent oxidoreductase (luciferase family)